MRTTGASAAACLLALAAVLLMACGYLIGYWQVFGEGVFASVTMERLLSLPVKVIAGFSMIAAAFVFIAGRLKGYACGRKLNVLALVLFALGLLAAMYVATYDRFSLMDLYPFAGVLVVSLLLFRFESRSVAALSVGIILFGFYVIGAKELGERDAERMQNERSELVTRIVT
ncbi:hypothetical protein [Pseudodesulfovibrio sp. zrk46]|uniref:hypothetical protein n=1 Tax=Pseudodesulfovibrio sp. zrk46 TaxID=2725288 RepID=UPI00144973A5|nr:hypothetical protein [Pseudodesulfovibrio sp. zrk46]QJB55555.1 hypothetical protein HFN16_03705 [Pseudodesulfovibrio sp. zrk46]